MYFLFIEIIHTKFLLHETNHLALKRRKEHDSDGSFEYLVQPSHIFLQLAIQEQRINNMKRAYLLSMRNALATFSLI